MSRIFGIALGLVIGFAGITAADAASKIQAIISPGGIKAWLVSEPSVPIVALDYSFKGGGNADPAGRPAVATMPGRSRSMPVRSRRYGRPRSTRARVSRYAISSTRHPRG